MNKWSLLLCLTFLFVACKDGGTTGSLDTVTPPDDDGDLFPDDIGAPDTEWSTDDAMTDGDVVTDGDADIQLPDPGFPDNESTDSPSWPDDTEPDDNLSDNAIQPDNDNEDDPLRLYKSGSRIRARFGETPDGAKQFIGWYDSQLSINCLFAETSEGIFRCVPAPLLYAALYADAACASPLFMVASDCGTVADWGMSTDECGRPHRIFRRGTIYTDTVAYARSNGTCTQTSLSYYTGTTFYTAGQEYPLSNFQTMTIYIE